MIICAHILFFILLIVGLTVCAWLNACLSYFISFCIDEGNIFEGWLPFITRKLKGGEQNFWFKPLGGCVVCANVWHGLITFWIWWAFGLYSLPYSVFLICPYILISNFLIRKMI